MKQMKFLIPTEPDDLHAIIVKLALEQDGHQVTTIFTADQPTRQKNSIFVDINNYSWQSVDRYNIIIENHYDVIWWRRPHKPYLPKGIAHPDDYNFVVQENTLFYEDLTHNLSPHAWWVNDKEAANRANFKLLQLKIASECGMLIPTTLCSNDPHEIKTFLLKYQHDGVLYKSLCSNYTNNSEQITMSHATKIQFLDLSNNQSIQQAPGIFQKKIKTQHELRVTCFGNYIVAAKLNFKKNIGTIVEPYSLPVDLQKKILDFMQELGIVFATFDFIVTEDNHYVFLEVNEQGQFLWLENYNQDLQMLDIFIQFITHKSTCFTWQPNQAKHRLHQYNQFARTIHTENIRKHVKVCYSFG
jgi:glutathione synthase/RimK-type ligase-like ATP-grasp enzyme